MKFRPLHDRVVVKRIDAEQKTAGGIIIPDSAQEKPSQGEIIAVGPGGRDESGKLTPIDVKVGDMVKKGQKMGIAGETGLAGGVHVHFSMQLDGVEINPREWWDEHWIKDRILSKL